MDTPCTSKFWVIYCGYGESIGSISSVGTASIGWIELRPVQSPRFVLWKFVFMAVEENDHERRERPEETG